MKDFRSNGQIVDAVVLSSSTDTNHQEFQRVEAQGNKVLRNTYLLLSISFIPAVLGSLITQEYFLMAFASSSIMGSLLTMALLYGLMFAIEKNNTSVVGIVLLQVFTFFLGCLTAPLISISLQLQNGMELIGLAFGGTAIIFFAMATLASVVKRPLTGLGNFLSVGVVILVFGIVANILLSLPWLSLVITCGILIVSSLSILWRINMTYHHGNVNYISLTLGLVIDLYLVFTSLLRLLLFSQND